MIMLSAVLGASIRPALVDLVSRIHELSAEKEMLDIDARRIVAAMTNEQTSRHCAMRLHPSHDMSPARAVLARADDAIAVFVSVACVLNAIHQKVALPPQ